MSRSGYTDDYSDDNWQMICWRGAVSSAIRGKRGQAFLKELLAALDSLPAKSLVRDVLEDEMGAVCAIGAVGKTRGLDMQGIDPEDYEAVAHKFGIATALAQEIVYFNDDWYRPETDTERFERMRKWVQSLVKESPS